MKINGWFLLLISLGMFFLGFLSAAILTANTDDEWEYYWKGYKKGYTAGKRAERKEE